MFGLMTRIATGFLSMGSSAAGERHLRGNDAGSWAAYQGNNVTCDLYDASQTSRFVFPTNFSGDILEITEDLSICDTSIDTGYELSVTETGKSLKEDLSVLTNKHPQISSYSLKINDPNSNNENLVKNLHEAIAKSDMPMAIRVPANQTNLVEIVSFYMNVTAGMDLGQYPQLALSTLCEDAECYEKMFNAAAGNLTSAGISEVKASQLIQLIINSGLSQEEGFDLANKLFDKTAPGNPDFRLEGNRQDQGDVSLLQGLNGKSPGGAAPSSSPSNVWPVLGPYLAAVPLLILGTCMAKKMFQCNANCVKRIRDKRPFWSSGQTPASLLEDVNFQHYQTPGLDNMPA